MMLEKGYLTFSFEALSKDIQEGRRKIILNAPPWNLINEDWPLQKIYFSIVSLNAGVFSWETIAVLKDQCTRFNFLSIKCQLGSCQVAEVGAKNWFMNSKWSPSLNTGKQIGSLPLKHRSTEVSNTEKDPPLYTVLYHYIYTHS